MQTRLLYVLSRGLFPRRQRGRLSAPLILAGVVIALVLVGMLYVTLQDSTPAVEAPVAGTVERVEPAPAPAVTPAQTTEAAVLLAPEGNFGARQLPPPVPTMSAQDSPVLNTTDEQRDGVVIAGQLLEAIEEEAEKEKTETGAVPLSPPQ